MVDRIPLEDLWKEFPVEEKDRPHPNVVKVVTFFQGDEGKVLAKLPSGMVVFRHREWERIINPGETWIVEIEQRGYTTSFAKGLQKLDANFFFQLTHEHVEQVVDMIWEKNRAQIEPLLEERLSAERIKNAIDEAIAAQSQQCLESLKEERSKRETLESEVLRLKIINTALEGENATLRTQKANVEEVSKEVPVADQEPFSPFTIPRVSIKRTGPDELESKNFNKRHYFVHVSRDQTQMTIRPHDSGNIMCLDNKLHLDGLGLIAPFNGPTELSAEYSPKYGGFLVLLKYTSENLDGA